jgi:hypothetical protein
MRQVDQQLWVAEVPLRYLGLSVGARMTVVRLPSGGLFVHSPVRLDPALKGEIDALGKVAALVAPNRYHHLFAGDWITAYPEAQAHCAPGLEQKRKDLAFAGVLSDDAPALWSDVIGQHAWRGAPMVSEVVFLHRPTRTLILTDTLHNLGEETKGLTRLVFRVIGGHGRLDSTWADKMVTRDRRAARASLEQILAWDFDRIVMSHGAICEAHAKDELRRAYRWLLR